MANLTTTKILRPSFILVSTLLLLRLVVPSSSIGINYGTLGNNLPPPAQVANFIKTQTVIDRVKIFDTNPDILRAFANTRIALTVSTVNGDIPALAQLAFARQWVAINVAPYYPQTNIIRILVGNEIFHSGDKQIIVNLIPAMRTLRNALVLAGFRHIQVSTPHSLGILGPFEPPSAARFKLGYQPVLRKMLQFLRETKSPFLFNPYPYFAYSPNRENYAVFKPNPGYYDRNTRITYTNMFDAMMDAVYSSMKALGYADVPIVVAETGWPSQGDAGQPAPTLANAMSYNQNLLRHVWSRKGTPLMPNRRFETYIFALFQENSKPGPLAERNWGLFNPDFSPVYHIGLLRGDQSTAPRQGGRARPVKPGQPRRGVQWCVSKAGVSNQALQANIDYVCSKGIDCRPIQAGGPCFDPKNIRAHASYVMNSFYRVNGAHPFNCDFANTGMLTWTNPSYGRCRLTEEVTDGNSWPPDTRTMGLISRAAFEVDNYWSIVQVLHKRLRQFDRRNWRVSYKALILLEHLVTHGPKSVADEFDGDVDVVKEMRNFQFVDEKGFNWGLKVQKLSERVMKLLEKDQRPYLEQERARARVLMLGIQGYGGSFDRGPTGKVDEACLGSSSTSMFGRCNSEYNTRNHIEESEDERSNIDDHHPFIEISHDRSATGLLSG